jgi:hypothetical protein
MSTTLPFGHFYKNLHCGREQLQTRMLPHSKMVLRHYVPSSNLAVVKDVRGMLCWAIEEEINPDFEIGHEAIH